MEFYDNIKKKEYEEFMKKASYTHFMQSYDFGEINLPIGRNTKNPEKMCISENGKPSITQYKVLERFEKNTFLELILITGRTHQIRVHLSEIGYPVVRRYGVF